MAEGSTTKWKDRWERLKARQQNEKEREHEAISVGIDTFASYAGAGLVGYLHGRKGGMPTVARMPIDALLAGAGSLVGFGLLMSGMSYGRHIAAFANGPGNYWFGGIMAKMGQEKRDKAGELLNRSYTTDEAEKANVQPRAPITAGVQRQRYAY